MAVPTWLIFPGWVFWRIPGAGLVTCMHYTEESWCCGVHLSCGATARPPSQ